MGFVKGSKHTAETRARMSATRKGKLHSEEHKAALSAALKGRQFERKHPRTCVCGKPFMAVFAHAAFCSLICRRASYGHGKRHSPQFATFEKACAICRRTDELVGDHNHLTGKPRGILCRTCNLAIGNMRDKPELLRAAAAYLEINE